METTDKEGVTQVPLAKALAIVKESVCIVECSSIGKMGTGFVIGHGDGKFFVATAVHVVRVVATLDTGGKKAASNPCNPVRIWFPDGPYDANFVLTSFELDIAVYKVESPRKMIPYVNMPDRYLIEGTDIAACGFIGDMKTMVRTGKGDGFGYYLSTITGIVSANIPRSWMDDKYVYQLDCTVYPGMSGGPLFTYYDGRPEVWGIVTTTVPILSGIVHHPLAWAISTKHLREGLTVFNEYIAKKKSV